MKRETNTAVVTREVSNNLLFSHIANLWLEVKKKTVKESSFCQYSRIVRTIINPRLQTLHIDEVGDDIFDEFSEEIFSEYKNKTARSIIVTVNQILEYSYKNGFIPSRQRVSNKTKNGGLTRPSVFTIAEQTVLTTYLLENFDLRKMGVLICLYSGLRLGEICGLKWSDIDMKNGIIKVNRTIQRISDGTGTSRFLIGTPKSEHSKREVPIPSFLQTLLLNHRVDDDCYVITGLPQFVQPRTYQNNLKKYFKECELPNYHFHSLRHTFASRAIELGFDPKTLSEILGHANVKITLDLYVHPSIEQKKRNMELFAPILENASK